jgi:predicted nucleic acid-binding Zn ribbon protein
VTPILPLVCPACGYRDECIRAATLAGRVIQDHGETCPRCGGRMRLCPGAPALRFRGQGWQTPKHEDG